MVQPEVEEEMEMFEPATMNWPFMLVAVRVLSMMELLLIDLVVTRPLELTTKLEPILMAPKEAPPVTERDVEVAAEAVIFPKAARPETLREPREAPPVTVSEVVVAEPAEREPRLVPP